MRVLSATLILSKNSRVLDASSRLKSANLGYNQLKAAKFDSNSTKNLLVHSQNQLNGGGGPFILHSRWCERTPKGVSAPEALQKTPSFIYNVQMDAAVLGDRLLEGTGKLLLSPGSPCLQCRH